MQYLPYVFFMLGLPFILRSPRWLASFGRNEDAIEVFANIQEGGDQDDPFVVAE